jgi:hypothetical protein
MLAVHQDSLAQAGGRVGFTPCNEILDIACQIWARPLWGGEYAVALYNAGAQSHDMTVNWETIDVTWTGKTVLLVLTWCDLCEMVVVSLSFVSVVLLFCCFVG